MSTDREDPDEKNNAIYAPKGTPEVRRIGGPVRPIGTTHFSFHGLKSKDKLRLSWDYRAPAWRMAVPGISLIGICKTRACVAFDKEILIRWGPNNFNFEEDEHLSVCPMCEAYVEPKNCGFSDIQWRVVGRRQIGSEPEEDVNGDWNVAEADGWSTFISDDSLLAMWSTLKLEVKPRGK
ncbi:uncharacterized protein H6S33_001284 [Morchella sextelata]|uniref:uncharacterized protein n=1 Tax=Morchella sextelata TaxID=1174677 RepID=UPI001D0538FA|nr:uncharacterized protein H6S33_001284 [Morchella sextelata]KAH0609056.1 hypothetical protein H6S33_001284 [Morchella sextelata]